MNIIKTLFFSTFFAFLLMIYLCGKVVSSLGLAQRQRLQGFVLGILALTVALCSVQTAGANSPDSLSHVPLPSDYERMIEEARLHGETLWDDPVDLAPLGFDEENVELVPIPARKPKVPDWFLDRGYTVGEREELNSLISKL